MHSKIRQLIEQSGRTLQELAIDSKVSYMKLTNWFSGRTKILDVEDAERLYKTLTGKEGFA